jgi:heme exporter protein C
MNAQTFNARVATPTTRLIGAMAIVSMAWVVIGGLIVTPKDIDQGDAVRIMYVHVPTAWVALLPWRQRVGCSVASIQWVLTVWQEHLQKSA